MIKKRRLHMKSKDITVGIVGLGLIGGSIAAALKNSETAAQKNAEYRVYGFDKEKSTCDFVKLAGNIDEVLDDNLIPECNVIILAVSPAAAIEWLSSKASNNLIAEDAIVIDCCGIKSTVCKACFEIANNHNFYFIGGHPMAGKQVGGYKNSNPNLFNGALFALVPNEEHGDKNDISLMSRIRSLLRDIGFRDFAVMTPEQHDEIIAFTSQLAHLISNAYIKSDMAEIGAGAALSGGAFRDMTRVAYLDETMWTELFMDNRENLLSELEGFISELERYKEALIEEDWSKLSALLTEGKLRKAEIDKKHI